VVGHRCPRFGGPSLWVSWDIFATFSVEATFSRSLQDLFPDRSNCWEFFSHKIWKLWGPFWFPKLGKGVPEEAPCQKLRPVPAHITQASAVQKLGLVKHGKYPSFCRLNACACLGFTTQAFGDQKLGPVSAYVFVCLFVRMFDCLFVCLFECCLLLAGLLQKKCCFHLMALLVVSGFLFGRGATTWIPKLFD